MLGPYPAGAKAARTDGAGARPDLERYLQGEYRGGMSRQELQGAEGGAAAKVRASVVRFVKQVLFDRNRLKPTPTA